MVDSVSGFFKGRKGDIPDIMDLRDLEAPEPLQRILETCTGLSEEAYLLVHLPHVPNPLFPHLMNRGMQWRVFEQADGSAQVLIWRAS